MMLPPLGTPARDALHADAVALALRALRKDGNVANALYAVYAAFRLRFLEERGLMDEVPGRSESSKWALADARVIEAYVCEEWRSVILAASAESGRAASESDLR